VQHDLTNASFALGLVARSSICEQTRRGPIRARDGTLDQVACLCEWQVQYKLWLWLPHIAVRLHVLKARLILVALICTSPAILLVGGLLMQALVAGIVGVALIIVARSLREGEAGFLVPLVRPLAAVAAVPALWVLIQVLPLTMFAHPIWSSAAEALGRPIAGAISIDPGASVIALSQYLSMIAVAFLSAAVALDRQRAEWLLFALAGACAVIALIVLTHDLFFAGLWLTTFAHAQAIDCAGMGSIIAGAACLRTVERYKNRYTAPGRSVPILLWTFAASATALVICAAASSLGGTYWAIFALGCGLVSFACVWIIRRLAIGPWSTSLIAAVALGIAIFLVAANPTERGRGVPLAFAAEHSSSLTALSERVLDDAPLVGTGAGTFAALAPIYREMDDPPPGSAAATAAAAFAIELGEPMLWLMVAAAGGAIITLLRASLQRGRDSFYPAMGGGCLITILLLAFTNAGLLGTATSLITAAALGLGFAQSKSRTPQS
jgi:hypothetical protein